jgi:hypothetical protein
LLESLYPPGSGCSPKVKTVGKCSRHRTRVGGRIAGCRPVDSAGGGGGVRMRRRQSLAIAAIVLSCASFACSGPTFRTKTARAGRCGTPTRTT